MLPHGIKPAQVLNVNVGVLGHVDSGKTSLVKSLSTLLSTASLDKNPQSIARGITLDLGFSAFLLPLPPRLHESASSTYGPGSTTAAVGDSANGTQPFEALQFTLVDCPGHASLIRTIIGGAQIIDMMILVVNVLKGIQTQTAECLVIGEITTRHLIVVLNKVDLLPEGPERTARIAKAKADIRVVLKHTKFANCPIVATAAIIGGERAAAVCPSKRSSSCGGGGGCGGGGCGDSIVVGGVTPMDPFSGAEGASGRDEKPVPAAACAASHAATPEQFSAHLGVETLLEVINETVELPKRANPGAPFFFSIDHCFAIKGQGTVVTGTVLSGSVKTNDLVEIPHLRAEKKVKSMQVR
jgi:selenocysteine-specific elongation factor